MKLDSDKPDYTVHGCLLLSHAINALSMVSLTNLSCRRNWHFRALGTLHRSSSPGLRIGQSHDSNELCWVYCGHRLSPFCCLPDSRSEAACNLASAIRQELRVRELSMGRTVESWKGVQEVHFGLRYVIWLLDVEHRDES